MALTLRNPLTCFKPFLTNSPFLWIFIWGLHSTLLLAQQWLVIDAFTQAPLPGVLIINSEQNRYVTTNEKGQFSPSSFSSNDTLVFQLLGYEKRQLPVAQIEGGSVALFLDEKQLEEIVLSVARTAEQSKKIAEQVQVISPKNTKRPLPLNGADLLQIAPSIRLQKSQGGGGSPVLRGFEANRVLLVIDGVRMNNAIYRSGHLQNALTIDPNNIDRVEVIYGSSSVGYGSDALGGVVHYYTKTPKINNNKKRKSLFSSQYNSALNAQIFHLENEHSFKKWASYTSLTFSSFGDIRMGKNRTHGYANWGLVPLYSANTNSSFFAEPSQNSNPNLQKNSGYRQFDVLQKLVFNLGQESQMVLNFQGSNSSQIPRFDKLSETRNGQLRFAQWYYGPQKRLLFSPQLKFFPKRSWMHKGTITGAYQIVEESRVQRKFGELLQAHQTENVNVVSLNGDFEITKREKASFAYGFEINQNTVRSSASNQQLIVQGNKVLGAEVFSSGITRYPSDGSRYNAHALYANMRYDYSPQTTWALGGRITQTFLNARWTNDNMLPRGLEEVAVQNTALTGSLSMSYRPSSPWRINLLLASGFRAPNIDDLGKIRESRGLLLVPNPELKSEYVYSLEGGVSFIPPSKKMNLQIRFYNSTLIDYIGRMPYGVSSDTSTPEQGTVLYLNEVLTTYANSNIGNSRIYGLSFEGKWRLNPLLTAGGNFTYTHGDVNEMIGPLPSILPLFGGTDLRYEKGSFSAEFRHQFASEKAPEAFSLGGEDGLDETPLVREENGNSYYAGTPKWTVFSLYSSYETRDALRFKFALENLLDIHYRTFASGISAPGRSVLFGVEVAF